MASGQPYLSDTAVAVLEMIAAGANYDRILSVQSTLTYLDIFDAAREALNLSASGPDIPRSEPAYTVAEVRQEHPNAYQRWTADADDELARRFREGMDIADLAHHFHRGEGAIRSRLDRLILVAR